MEQVGMHGARPPVYIRLRGSQIPSAGERWGILPNLNTCVVP